MNEAAEQVNAMLGVGTGAEKPAADDYKAKYEEAMRQLQSAKVEQGRVAKFDSENKELRRQLAELSAKKRNEDLASTLSDEERAEVPDEILNVATKLVNNGIGRLQEENERRLQEMEQRRAQEAEASRNERKGEFLRRLDARFPGFRSDVSAGGDKADAWKEYLQYNSASINAAFADLDFRAIEYHLEQFYTRHLGIPVPSGSQDGTAAPDPRSSGGGSTGVNAHQPGKIYTQSEYLALYDLVEAARAKGDYAEMKRLNAEIDKAPAEGRVK